MFMLTRILSNDESLTKKNKLRDQSNLFAIYLKFNLNHYILFRLYLDIQYTLSSLIAVYK